MAAAVREGKGRREREREVSYLRRPLIHSLTHFAGDRIREGEGVTDGQPNAAAGCQPLTNVGGGE